MEVSLSKVLEAEDNGIFSAKRAENGDIVICKTAIPEDGVNTIAKNLGWNEHKVDSLECLSKTHSFLNAAKRAGVSKEWLANTTVEFYNKPDSVYGRTFDRYVIVHTEKTHKERYTIIKGMKNAGGACVLYINGNSNPKEKYRTLKQFFEDIVNEKFADEF